MDLTLDLKSIIAIIAVITTVTVAYLSNWWRNRKNLSFEITANSQLLTAREEVKDDLNILFKGRPLKNARLLVLKILNSGKQPIDEKDFKKPLNFVFNNDSEIISAEILSVSPENLDATLSFDLTKVSINPTLLNSKDFIEIKVIINSKKISYKFDTRIIGISEIKEIKRINPVYKEIFLQSLITLSFLIIGLILTLNSESDVNSRYIGYALIGSVIFYWLK